MKCGKCGQEITREESHEYQGQALCDDCYLEATSPEKTCDPWATYLSTQTREQAGLKGEEGLTETEKEVYQYIRQKGRATREEIMQELGLSREDLAPQLHVLMHVELITEHGEGDRMYLVPIPVTK